MTILLSDVQQLLFCLLSNSRQNRRHSLVFWAKVYAYDLDCTRGFFLYKVFLVGTWW